MSCRWVSIALVGMVGFASGMGTQILFPGDRWGTFWLALASLGYLAWLSWQVDRSWERVRERKLRRQAEREARLRHEEADWGAYMKGIIVTRIDGEGEE